MLGKRFVIGVGAKSSVKPQDLRDAFGVWFLSPEFEVIAMGGHDQPRTMCRTLAGCHPFVTCVAIQGGKVAMIQSDGQKTCDGEWVYVSNPDYGEYTKVIRPDPVFLQQQHMKHVHHLPIEDELAVQRAPAQVLLGIILEEVEVIPQNLRSI